MIVVIAILALIVIGRLLSATRRAKEVRMQADLRQMRQAIMLFENDTGAYPAELTDIVARTQDQLSGALPENARALYRGPYLSTTGGGIQLPDCPGLPINPYVSPLNLDISAHWTYDEVAGTVQSAVVGITLFGVPYSDL